MSRIIALIISFLLVGCATPPMPAPRIVGEVRMSRPLSRIAHIDVSMFGLYEGKVREVQRTHFETGNLPLFFSIKLNPAQRGEGELYLRSTLSFPERGVQAVAQQKLTGKNKVVLQMIPKTCYPNCQLPNTR